jgi:O-antigen ligase
LGIFLAVALVVSIALFEKIKNKTERGVMLVCILSMTAGLVVTFARGAWCATAAGLLVLFLVRAHQDADLPVTTRYQRGRDLLAMYFVVGLMAASYVGVLQPIVVTRVQANSFLEQRSVSERVSQYRDAALSIFHHPFFGVGPGAYTSYVFIQYPERDAAGYQPVHSVYALALAELGVPAAVLIAYTILCWLWRRLFSAELMALCTCLAVAGLFDHWLVSMWGGWLLVVMVLVTVDGSYSSRYFLDNDHV